MPLTLSTTLQKLIVPLMVAGVLFSIVYMWPAYSKKIVVDNCDRIEESKSHGRNIVFVFTGRWKFLRIQFMYLFRDLRKNGGVVDKVLYMMLNYEQETHSKLI